MSTKPETTSAIIVAASSDIGAALARRWRGREWSVAGTFRTASAAVEELHNSGVQMLPCDLSRPREVHRTLGYLRSNHAGWDVLVLASGELSPIGPFGACDYADWERSLRVNLLTQLEFVHGLLPSRRRATSRVPTVLFFAGGGTNSATVNFSAYTLSKISLTKMCELLDAEIPDVKFVILGPGWVRTKIHDVVLQAGTQAGSAYGQTRERLQADNFTPVEKVLDCCDWAIAAPREAVGGRNFSVTHDSWQQPKFIDRLISDTDLCKLRRHGNNLAAADQSSG